MTGGPVEVAATLEIRLFGTFQIIIDGHELPAGAWRRRKARTLVKLLALAPARSLHREQLFDRLWPELPPTAAANNLHQAIHLARRAFASGGLPPNAALRYAGERLELAPRMPVTIDLAQFAAAAALARARRDLESYRAAINWYRGELLPEDPYETWAEESRAHFRELHLSLLLECAVVAEREGEIDTAIDALQTALATDPCHEPACRALMTHLARQGRRSDALRLYDQVAAALERELGVTPDRETRRLVATLRTVPPARIEADIPAPAAPSTPHHNLPMMMTSFIGREHETEDTIRLLAGARLVTLTGPGGCGKTRIALTVAECLLAGFCDGLWFVDLASVTRSEGVAPAVAAALGVRETPGQPLVRTLIETIGRRRMLMLFDNCEQVVTGCAMLAAELLRHCPGLTLLATSREPLRIAGEVTRLVPSLPLPDPNRPQSLTDLLELDSVRLFVERARTNDPAYQPAVEEAGALARLCYRLDGMPLAIELAAANHRLFSVQEIAARLDDRFHLFVARDRLAVDRQRTLQATLDWSHDLLTDDEHRVFRRLAVFPASFGIEAAERIAQASDHDLSPLTAITALVEKSLLLRERAATGTRFRMLETIRQYGRVHLAASGDEPGVRRLHAGYFLAMAETVARDCYGPLQDASLDRLDAEREDLRAAIAWALGSDGDSEIANRLAIALVWYWQVRGSLSEGRDTLTRVVTLAGGDPVLAARAQTGLGAVVFFQDDFALARSALARGLELLARAGDLPGYARALGWFALLHVFQGELELGRGFARQAETRCAAIDDRWGRATALMALTFADIETGETERATGYCRQALVWYRQLGEHWGSALAARTLGSIAYRQGDYATAREHAIAALAIERAQRDPWLIVQSLSLIGEIARAHEDWDEAAARCKESLTLSRECGHRANTAWSLRSLGFVAAEQGKPGEAAELLAEALTIFRESSYPLGMLCALAGMTVTAATARMWDDAARWAAAVTALLAIHGGRLAPADDQPFQRAIRATRLALAPEREATARAVGLGMALDQVADQALAAAVALSVRTR